MSTFKDEKDRVWKMPRLTNGIVLDIADDTGIHLANLAKDTVKFIELVFQPFEIGAVLYSLLKEQIKTQGIDEREFLRGLSGESLESAGEALMNAVIDFFPRSKVAQQMKASLRAGMVKLDEGIVEKLKNLSGDLPGSSE